MSRKSDILRCCRLVWVQYRLIQVMEVTCAAQATWRLQVSGAIRLTLTVRFSLMLVLSAVAGCSSIGPDTVPRDRLDYISAIGKSWKEQTLLNVVRLRYGDAPTFVDVSSVISGYTFQGQVSAGASSVPISRPPFPQDWRRSMATPHTLIVRRSPTRHFRGTICAKPSQTAAASEVFELVQAGYPADDVLLITTRAVNGIYNRSGIGARAREADPTFYPLLDALRRLQLSGGVSIRLVKRGSEEVGLLILSGQRAQTVADDLQFVRKTLGITTDRNGEVTVSFGLLPRGPNEIAILTRSMAEILLEVAAGIEVPTEHVAQGRTAAATRVVSAESPRDRPLVRIQSSASAPARAMLQSAIGILGIGSMTVTLPPSVFFHS